MTCLATGINTEALLCSASAPLAFCTQTKANRSKQNKELKINKLPRVPGSCKGSSHSSRESATEHKGQHFVQLGSGTSSLTQPLSTSASAPAFLSLFAISIGHFTHEFKSLIHFLRFKCVLEPLLCRIGRVLKSLARSPCQPVCSSLPTSLTCTPWIPRVSLLPA